MAVEVPFVGLSPFDAQHRAYFFGRTADSTIVAANILSNRITVVFGRSGVGKTSVMQAGVPPALETFEPTTYLCVRTWQEDPHAAFVGLLKETAAKTAGAKSDEAATALTMVRAIVEATERPLVFVFDQFEEFFQGANAASRERFEVDLSLILSALECDVHVALSIRDDALYRLDALKGRIPEIMSRTIEIGSLSLEAAAEAVRGPVAKFNQEHGTDYGVDDDLVDALLREVVSKPRFRRRTGDGDAEPEKPAIEAPFLQLALKVLWDSMIRRGEKRLSQRLLDDLGGAEEIIDRHLDAVIKSAKGDESYLAVIFDRLITPDGHKIALSLDEITKFVAQSTERNALTADDKARIKALLTKLATGDERILRITEGERYELFHDILAEPVIERVRAFNQGQRDRRRRRRLVYSSAAALVVVVMLVVLIVLQSQRREAIARELAGAAVAELNQGNPRGAVLAAIKTLELMPEAGEPHIAGEVQRALWGGLARLRSGRVLNIATGGGCLRRSLDAAPPMGNFKEGDEPRSHDHWVYGVDFSPDGTRVVTGGGDSLARVWDVRTGQCVCQLEGHTGAIRGVAFRPRDPISPDERVEPFNRSIVATASLDGTARLWDAGSCSEIGTLAREGSNKSHSEGVRAVAFSHDGSLVITGSYDNTARVWNAATLKPIALLPAEVNDKKPKAEWSGHIADILSVAFSPTDRNIVATASYDTTARIWDISDPAAVTSRPLLGHEKEVYSVAFSPNGREVATSSTDDSVRVWDVAGGKMIRGPLNAHKFDIWRAVYGTNASFPFKEQALLVTGGWDQAVRVWSANTFQALAELVGHTEAIRDVAVSRDGRFVASGSSDRTARLWNLVGITGVESIHHHPQRVTSIAAAPPLAPAGEASLFATGSNDGVVRLFHLYASCPQLRLTDGFLKPAVEAPAGAAGSMPAESPKPATDGGTCDERPFTMEDYNSGAVQRVLIDPTGKILFAAYECGRIVAWNLPDGTRRWMNEPEYGGGSCVPKESKLARAVDLAFLAPENQLAIVAQQRDPARGKVVRVDALTGKPSGSGPDTAADYLVNAIATNSDGTLMAVADSSLTDYQRGRIRLFRIAADGTPGESVVLDTSDLRDLRPVKRLAFSADGHWLAGAADRAAIVFALSPGSLVAESRDILTGHAGTITDLTFDPNGRFLFTTSSDETIRVWNLATSETIYEFAPQFGTIQTIALTGDGNEILAGGDDRTAVAVDNLADFDKAVSKTCDPVNGARLALNPNEADRLLSGVPAVDVDLLSFLPVVTRSQLEGPIVCPKSGEENARQPGQ